MFKLLSDSILIWGAVVAPAGDQCYKGLLALVSHILRPGICNITLLLNYILKSAQIPNLKESRFFSNIPTHLYNRISNDNIAIPYSEADNNLIRFISSLLKIEKIYFKYYLLKLSQYPNKKLFKKILLIVIKATLSRIESLQDQQIHNKEIKDLLTLYYFEGFLEIILTYDSYFTVTESSEMLFKFLKNEFVLKYWINNVELNYTCADYINKVANFIKTNYTFSKQLVSANKANDTTNDTTKDPISYGVTIYDELVNFYLSCDSKNREKLTPTISAMENYLYMIIKNHQIPDNDNIYDTLSDISKWHSVVENIIDEFYSAPHLLQDTGRGGYETIFIMLNHYCFNFLNNSIKGVESIPRKLKSYLHERLAFYSKIPDANLKSLIKDTNGIISSKNYPVCSEDLCTRIIDDMEYLIKGNEKQKILQCEEDLEKLRHYFQQFCKIGIPTELHENEKIKLCYGKKQLFYGFFFNLLGTGRTQTESVHIFLEATMYGYDVGQDSLVSQAMVFYRKYATHINKIKQLL